MSLVTVKSQLVGNHHVATLVYDRDYVLNSVTFKRLGVTSAAPYDLSGLVGAAEEEAVRTCLANGQNVNVYRIFPTDPGDLADCMTTPRRVNTIVNASNLYEYADIVSHTPVKADAISLSFDCIADDKELTSGIFSHYHIRSAQYGDEFLRLKIPAPAGITAFRPTSVYYPAGVGSIVTLKDAFIASASVTPVATSVPSMFPAMNWYNDSQAGYLHIERDNSINFYCAVTEPIICKISFSDPDLYLEAGTAMPHITSCNGVAVNSNTITITPDTPYYTIMLAGVDRSKCNQWRESDIFSYCIMSVSTLDGVFIFKYDLTAGYDAACRCIATFTELAYGKSVAYTFLHDNLNYTPLLDSVSGLPTLDSSGEPINIAGNPIALSGTVAYNAIDLVIAANSINSSTNITIKVFTGADLDTLYSTNMYTSVNRYPMHVHKPSPIVLRVDKQVLTLPTGSTRALIYPFGIYLDVVG